VLRSTLSSVPATFHHGGVKRVVAFCGVFVVAMNLNVFGMASKRVPGRASVVQIKFVRSGGIAGNMTRVEGSIDLGGDKPAVTSEAGQYKRILAPEEADKLRCAVDTTAKCEPQRGASGAPPIPDAMTYNITVTQQDGKTRSLSAQPERGPGAQISPELMSWIQAEAKAIWAHRLSQRSGGAPSRP
jgi:hypothetical protein